MKLGMKLSNASTAQGKLWIFKRNSFMFLFLYFQVFEIVGNILRWFHGKCEEVFGEEILEAASEHGFRCSLCRPHGKLQINDSLNILVCDNVAMNRSAWEVLQMRYGGLLTKSSLTFHNETIYGAQYYGYGARTHSYDGICCQILFLRMIK